MSNVNYTLNRHGVRPISAREAWVKGKNGKLRLDPKHSFVGKVETTMPSVTVQAKSAGGRE